MYCNIPFGFIPTIMDTDDNLMFHDDKVPSIQNIYPVHTSRLFYAAKLSNDISPTLKNRIDFRESHKNTQ